MSSSSLRATAGAARAAVYTPQICLCGQSGGQSMSDTQTDRQTDKQTHKQTSTSMSAVSVWSVVQVQRTPTRQCRLVYASRWRLWYRGRRHSARDTDDTIRHEMQSERALESRHETAKSTARNRKLKSGRRSIASKRQRSIGKQSAGNPWSQSRRRKGRLRWEGFVEKKGNERVKG